MLSFRHLLPAFAAMLSAAMPAAWGAVDIADTQVTNVGTTTFTVVWTTSEVSTAGLDVYSDVAGTNAITGTLGLDYYPLAEGDPLVINTTVARAGRRALELLASNRRVVVVRVTGLAPGTTYFVRPRTFGSNGLDNGSGLLPLKSVTTAEFSSLVGDGRLVRIRFPAFAAEGMVALLQGPAGASMLSAIVGDSTDADSAVFPLANLLDAASGTNALFTAPQSIAVRVIGAGAPGGTFTRTINFGPTFAVANYESIDADLTSPAPFIATQPVNRTVQVGTAATFTIAATGTPVPGYKWQRQPAGTSTWSDLVEGAPYLGVATTTLTVSSATLAMSGDQFRAVASNGILPDATSSAATLTVNLLAVAPSITTQPVSATALTGGSATFTIAASGTPSPSAKWQRQPAGTSTWSDLIEGAPYSGVATTTLTVSSATLAMSGDQFRAIAANGVSPDATSNAATLTVNLLAVAPSITTQPVSATALTGGSATFTIAASGTPSPSAKWQRQPAGTSTWSDLIEGAPYSGVATTTLTVSSATLAMSGDQFRAIAANGVAPDATSNAATLTVNLVAVAPSITTQPVSATALTGGSATFTIAASGTPSPSVKWQRQPAGTSTWSDLIEGAPYSGVATTTLTVSSATLAMSGDQFRAIAANGVSPDATSNAVTLTVNLVAVAPSITTQPVSATALTGGSATFTIAASGTPSPSAKWQRQPAGTSTWSDLIEGAPYLGVATTTLTVSSATLAMSGDQFRAIAANGVAPDATSNAATLTVNLLAVAPSITTQPVSATALTGGSATFTIAASGTPSPSAKWQRQPAGTSTWSDLVEGAPYSGVATATLTVSSATLAMSGDQFRAIAANGVAPDATSNAASLTVNAVSVSPSITTQPRSTTVAIGAPATFTVTVAGTPLSGVAWQRQPVGSTGWSSLANGLIYSGVATSALTVNGTTLGMSGDQFRVVASNGVSPDATSEAATLTVITPVTPPVITSQPASQTVMEGTAVTFTVGVGGTMPIAYQWRKDGVALTGATSSALTLSSVQVSDAGNYAAVVSNAGGTTTSSAASLTVTTLPPPPPPAAPIITVQPRSTSFSPGSTVVLSVAASGAAPLRYQWFKEDTAINGATGATLTFARASIPTAGRYHVVVSNASGSVTSRDAVLSLRFAGTYFGNFGGNHGRFALYIRGDQTGVFLGYDQVSRVGLISRSVVIDDFGRFRVVVRGGAPASTSFLSAGAPARAAAEADYLIDGSITESGTVTGSVSGLDLTFSASAMPASGNTTAVAGFYQAGAVGSSASSYTIISPAGDAFVVTTNGATTDAGKGTVTASGEMEITTENNARVTGTVQVGTSIISTTMITADGAPMTFVGANHDVRVQVEKLVNVSTRTQTGTASNTLIAGFVITGTERKLVLVRAIGPTLARFNVTDPLGAAHLEVFRDQIRVGAGGDWGAAANAPAVAAAAARIGAFELPANSRDAALLLSLEPGAYTAQVTGQAAETGVSLVEVYDATEGDIPPAQRIVNVSTRAVAGAGDQTLIAGFVINGSIPKRVLIRGAGPALAQFGVTGALARPQLTVFSGSTAIAQNAGWSTSPESSALVEAATQVGAFAFAPGSQDAALILSLAPGPYTAQVTGVDRATGVALIEVYEMP